MRTDRAQGTAMPTLQIMTFGTFSVKIGDVDISKDSRRQQKIWTLLKYIITNRKRRIPPEDFFDILWGNEECDNPQKALQNLIYRLRLVLAQGDRQLGEGYIQFSQGCYLWNPQLPCQLDIVEFEEHNSKGLSLEQNDNVSGAIEHYLAALNLYRGNFLSENSLLPWVIPVANSYRRLYVNITTRVVGLLRALKRYEDITHVCEQAFTIEPYEEPLHAAFIDALIDLDKPKQARSHYEFITTALYREFGVRPSQVLKDTYQRMSEGVSSVNMDLDVLQELLSEHNTTSDAFLCDADLFRSIYKLEARRAARSGQVVFLVLMTILNQSYQTPDARTLKETNDALGGILLGTLRRGDVVSRWNDSQYIIMLASLTYEDSEIVVRRLCDKFAAIYHNSGILVKSKLQPVTTML